MGREKRATSRVWRPVTVVALALLGAILCLQAAPASSATFDKWSYRGEQGPEHWATLSPSFSLCKEGKAQSPIDLAGARPGLEEPLVFRYRSNSLILVNDGRALRMDFEPGSYIRVGARRYELLQADFHAPSEHRINGMPADMAAQFLHRDIEGNLALVEVPIVAGRRMNNVLERVWENLPERPGSSFQGRQVGINPTFLLPNERAYYSYRGSLSHPPCTEGVQWFVFQKPLEVEAGLIHRLLDLFGPNARPLQPLNGRSVSLQPR